MKTQQHMKKQHKAVVAGGVGVIGRQLVEHLASLPEWIIRPGGFHDVVDSTDMFMRLFDESRARNHFLSHGRIRIAATCRSGFCMSRDRRPRPARQR
jgi:hypothetical protein